MLEIHSFHQSEDSTHPYNYTYTPSYKTKDLAHHESMQANVGSSMLQNK